MSSLLFINVLFLLFVISTETPFSIDFSSYHPYSDDNKNENDEQKIDSFYEDLENTYFYSLVKIGTPPYELSTFYDDSLSSFILINNCHFNYDKDISVNNNFFFDYHNSNSFKCNSDWNEVFLDQVNACYSEDNFVFNKIIDFDKNKKEDITLNNINFIMGQEIVDGLNKDKTNYNCLSIGLKLFTIQNSEKTNDEITFIHQLKSKNLINSYIWGFYFTDNNSKNLLNYENFYEFKGNFIFGFMPHELSDKFYESQITSTYAIINSDIYPEWELKFDKIMIDNEKIFNITNAKLKINSLLIYAPKEYYEYISENFFNELIKNKICNYNYYDDDSIYIYCDKSSTFNNEHLKKLPTLKLEHKELNYTFEFTYEDLFIEKDNKYYFLVILDKIGNSPWQIGYIFFKNYQFMFDQDNKRILFYNPLYEKISNEEKKGKEGGISLLIITILIICVVLIIACGLIFLYLCKKNNWTIVKKKKRANELDDDFEYQSHNDNNEKKENALGV